MDVHRSLVGLCLALAVILALALPACAQATDQSLSLEAHNKYDAGGFDQAEVLFARLLAEFPSSTLAPDAQYHLGWIAYKKQTGEAESRWQAVVDRYPMSPEAPKALRSIAAVHYKAGASKESQIADYEGLIALYPGSPEAEEAWFRIGALQNREPPDFEKALTIFRGLAADAVDPKWRAEAYVNIGMTYLQRYFNQGRKNPEDLTQAMAVFSAARAMFPDQADAVLRGELRQAKHYLYSERNIAKARDAFNEILEAYPETKWTTEFLYLIAYCSFEERDYLECIQLCEDILAERPPSDWQCYVQYFIGHCYVQAGRKADARAAFEKTISVYPETNWARCARTSLEILGPEEGAQ